MDTKYIQRHNVFAAILALGLAAPLHAQTRATLPAGSVILVRTEQALLSAQAQVGQTFETSVVEPVSVNGYTLIPAGSRIRGAVTYVQPATRDRSGVMQIAFNRVTLPGGGAFAIVGKLTSTDSTERRQIDSRADSRVVLVGESGGLGAAIAGAGSSNSPASGILAALGNMLSEKRDVSVPAGTQLAVQLEQSVALTSRGGINTSDTRTIYTAAERIRAAQQALARRSYYRGSVTGVLDNSTRKALFEFQLDNNITATGNLDGRTAAALGILNANNTAGGSGVLSAREAGVLRRAAAALTSRQRQELGISAEGVATADRQISENEVDLLFAFSAFQDNSALYDQLVRSGSTSTAAVVAGRALINAARRVDSAMQRAQPSPQVQNVWTSIRRQLAAMDPSYR